MFNQDVINNFWNSIVITGKGMFGIFIFMGLFYLIIKLLDRIFPKEIEREKSN
jgi:hypothetical protein